MNNIKRLPWDLRILASLLGILVGIYFGQAVLAGPPPLSIENTSSKSTKGSEIYVGSGRIWEVQIPPLPL